MASSPSSPTLLSFVGIPETSRRMESSWGSRFFSSMNWCWLFRIYLLAFRFFIYEKVQKYDLLLFSCRTRSFIPANIFFNSQMLQVKYTPSRGRSQEQCSNHQSCGPPLNRTVSNILLSFQLSLCSQVVKQLSKALDFVVLVSFSLWNESTLLLDGWLVHCCVLFFLWVATVYLLFPQQGCNCLLVFVGRGYINLQRSLERRG